jgi:glutamate-1-semialdehyde 2,1-aminomutase
MPGGDTRNAAHFEPYPITIMSGEAGCVRDVDGNEYLDLGGNYTSLAHGHAYPPVVEAVKQQASRGTAWGARSEPAIALAQLLTSRIHSVEELRFTNSGTEAGMLAAQLARHITGRRKILMVRFGYHGSYSDFRHGSKGIAGPETAVFDFGSLESLQDIVEKEGAEIAALFIEPVLGSAGVISPPPGFLAAAADLARAVGMLVVADEVVTFRLAEGGAQAVEGFEPDLTMLGKTIGGGLPVGALGGTNAAMEAFNPGRPGHLTHSGTFNGNPLTMAAGLVAVAHLDAQRIAVIDSLAERLEAGLVRAGHDEGIPVSVSRKGSILNLFLAAQVPPPGGYRDPHLADAFHVAMLNHGVLHPTRGMMATCTAMTPADIDHALDATRASLRDIAPMMDAA